MYKLVTFSGYDNRSGPHIFPIEPDRDRTIGHIKMARPLPARVEHYIKTAAPIDGKAQLLIDAMGAGEFWGSNVNGDYFPEKALSHPGKDYGYETFMHYAYPFKHHVNKDPARAYGDRVTLADYDRDMHRVLLIVSVDTCKCQDILSDLDRNVYWDVSMGCRVPWDECSVCKNRARNRGEYCPHLRYQMNKILPNGKRVCALNWLPKFFDISFVTIGAEKASHVLQKVAFDGRPHEVRQSAELGELHYAKLASAEKQATRKQATMVKEVPSNPSAEIEAASPEDKERAVQFMCDAGAVKEDEPELPRATLDALAQFPLDQVFSTLAALGIDLRPQEFQRIVLVKQGAAALADRLEQHRLVFDETKVASRVPVWARNFTHFNENAVTEKVAMVVRRHVAERSCYPEVLLARLERMEKCASLSSNPVRHSQWYPMSDDEKREASGISGLVPASVALATGFMVFRKLFPGMKEKGPGAMRALAKHPWLLPLLLGAGVGASVGFQSESTPRPLSPYGTGSGLDAKNGPSYHEAKTAGINPVARFGLIPLAYMYAGVQQKRWRRGEQLNAFDRAVAQRPDLAALLSFAAVPRIGKGVKNLVKQSGVLGDMALYTVGSPTKMMPAVLAGAALDTAIFGAIRRLAARKQKENAQHAHSR